ncbi:MAG TPA: PepSY-associated TM helix domain-containing protein [Phycisphaerae bacterium]|nr:PepSY-associated TM helix domain-containing protein [Phycisphaerae bacterium]
MSLIRPTRRIHLCFALFFTPWLLMYGLSAVVLNHRDFFARYYGGHLFDYEMEQELPYQADWPDDAEPQEVGRQVLDDLGMAGAYWAQRWGDDVLAIHREDPIWARRIVVTPKDETLRIERQIFRIPSFLFKLHRRRGYQQDYLADDVWALSIDVLIVCIIFWVVSGVWMWMRMSSVRRWGGVSLVIGCGLFLFFLVSI